MKDNSLVRKMLEEYIKNSRELIEALPYPLSVHDTEFNIIAANRSFLDICGKKGGVKDMKCHKLFHCTDKSVESCPMERTLKSGKYEQSEIYAPSIEKFITVTTSPVIVKGNIIGIFHSVIDITEQKKSQEHYEELIDVYSSAVNEMKTRERDIQKGRDAFFNMLEDISESYKELQSLFVSIVESMINALDAKSPWTKGHSENVAMYAEKIANEMDFDDDNIKALRLAGILHDIGKIGTYDTLLDKPGKLTDEEFEAVKKHPAQGAVILEAIKQLNEIIPIIRHHHERIDGTGYPDGLKGNEIPLGARILHVADSFDSMTSDRPYRTAPGIEYAVSEFKKHSGLQFDPDVVKAFLKVIKNDRHGACN